jgi:hypothetical protein
MFGSFMAFMMKTQVLQLGISKMLSKWANLTSIGTVHRCLRENGSFACVPAPAERENAIDHENVIQTVAYTAVHV